MRETMKTTHKWHLQILCIAFFAAVLSHFCTPAQQNTFSVEGVRLGMTRTEVMKYWRLAEAAKSNGDILVLERGDQTSVMVYLRGSSVGSIVGESLTRDDSRIRIGDAQASVRRDLGSPTESSVYPSYKGRRESRDIYRSLSIDGQKVVTVINYSQERVVSCFLTYADCETILDP